MFTNAFDGHLLICVINSSVVIFLIFTNIAEIPTNPQKTIEAIIIANDFLKQLGDLYPNLKVSLPIFN